MPRDSNPYPVPAKVRVCRSANCAARADSGAVPGFCVEHAHVILTFRRFLAGNSEFVSECIGFDRARVVWERMPRSG